MAKRSSVCLRYLHLGLILALLGSLVLSPWGVPTKAQGDTPTSDAQARALLEKMTPEERVGQLFLVTFQGAQVDVTSPIYELITAHHVGGVVLLARNNNILSQGNDPMATLEGVDALTRALQESEWRYSQQFQADARNRSAYQPVYVPLLIGIAQEGDGYPYSQIMEGVTMLPNQMALGATWLPDLAARSGEVLGRELSALGINLLFGPLLDVLDTPRLDAAGTLATRAFGGDPYWVGKMGQAYIRGVHLGSQGRMIVAASHFPGHGSADRLPEEEVATVRKSLDELVAIDLAPFLSVTGNAPSLEETTDALLTSHIRYQGLQGNLRAATRPVSFDPQALSLLLELPGLAEWRQQGGVLISDDLGNLAVRRFLDLTNQTFDARRVALNAFLAGNDLLFIGDFSSPTNPDSFGEALRTLDFFTQKYREDAAFARRVDDSVARILALKYRLYPQFNLEEVNQRPVSLGEIGRGGEVTFAVAQEAATLLSPSQEELDIAIPDPPKFNERIVFISDVRPYQQCKTCPLRFALEGNALQNAVLRLYGPQAGGQILPNNLSSYTLQDLQSLLNGEAAGEPLFQSLQRAQWVVFGMLNEQGDVPSYQTLRRFLNERPALFQQKRLIVFAFNAPYYLDATDISKLSAFFALYSKGPAFVDVAAYLLFGELRASGAPPVSVPGVRYNLNEALFPDPKQTISLQLDLPAAPTPSGGSTAEPSPTPEFHLGEIIALRTGVILDHNRNPVPDGTPVTFLFSWGGEAATVRQVEYTRGGVARTTFTINAAGTLEIRAESEGARSESLRLDIPAPGGGTPAVLPTETPTPTPTTIPPTPTPEAIATPVASPPSSSPPPLSLADWLIALLVTSAFSFFTYRLAALLGHVRWGVRAALLASIGGLLSYSYLALYLNQHPPASEGPVWLSVFFSAFGGCVLGLVGALAWRSVNLWRHEQAVLSEVRQEGSVHQRDRQADQ